MKRRQLGNTGVSLSAIGFGAWALGGAWRYGWGAQNDAESVAIIRRALDLGVNWIDTAAAYSLGRNEEVVAAAVAGRRDDVFIATKCGLVWDAKGNVTHDLRPESIRREVEGSLRRLRTDVIDLYQIHWPDPAGRVPIEDAWGAMADLVKEGKVRFIGVSNFDVPLMKRCRPIHPIASLQPPYNMLGWEIDAEARAYCVAHNIGVIVKAGLLTDRFRIDRVAADDWRRRRWGDGGLSRAAALSRQLRPIAEAHGATVAQVAVAWVLRRPEVSSAVMGARLPGRVKQNARAADLTLTDADVATIAVALSELGAGSRELEAVSRRLEAGGLLYNEQPVSGDQ